MILKNSFLYCLTLLCSFDSSDRDVNNFDNLPRSVQGEIYDFSLGKEIKVKLDKNEFKNFFIGSKYINKFHHQKVIKNNYMIDDYFKFVDIQSGTYDMVSFEYAGDFDDEEQEDIEEHISKIKISKFSMQTTQVTQFQYWLVTKNNPSKFKEKVYCPEEYIEFSGISLCPNHPVENVTWEDAQLFIQKLNKNSEAYVYSLPTESQWEYAARAGTTTLYSFGDNVADLDRFAWFKRNSGNQTHQVAILKPNDFGLFDVHGNVMEWVIDNWSDNWDRFGINVDPIFINLSSKKVLRGGSYNVWPRSLRSADRCYGVADQKYSYLGFRMVRKRIG